MRIKLHQKLKNLEFEDGCMILPFFTAKDKSPIFAENGASVFVRRWGWLIALALFFAPTFKPFSGGFLAMAGEGGEKPAKSGKGKKKKASVEAQHKEPEERLKDDQARYQITNNYVHQWEPLRPVSGQKVENPDKTSVFEPRFGEATMVVFLASWCLPCQHIIGDLLKLEKDFNTKNTRFVYVFTQDEAQDALGFVKTYGMNDAQHGADHIIGTDEIQKAFHYPPLPSYYLADRRGWLCMRSLQATRNDLMDARQFLDLQTSY